ncbi:MAG: hypothetical protein IJX38_03305 [Clostridia bacterium]|nr:hypothetical protein [Clostridia bacterium]
MYDKRNHERLLALLRLWLGINNRSKVKLDEAIIKFKAENGLGDGAEVDFNTFSALREAYRRRKANERHPVLRRGDQSDSVAELNLMLRRIIPCFNRDIPLPGGSYFGAQTEEAIKYLRKAFMLEGEPWADGELYERMITELDSQKFFNN